MTATVTVSTNEELVTHVLLVGSPGIGKTCLARTITDGAFPSADFLAKSNPCKEEVTVKYRTNQNSSFKFGDGRDCYDLEMKEVIKLDDRACPSWEDMKGVSCWA